MKLSSVVLICLLVLFARWYWDEYSDFRDRFALLFMGFVFVLGAWNQWAEDRKLKK